MLLTRIVDGPILSDITQVDSPDTELGSVAISENSAPITHNLSRPQLDSGQHEIY